MIVLQKTPETQKSIARPHGLCVRTVYLILDEFKTCQLRQFPSPSTVIVSPKFIVIAFYYTIKNFFVNRKSVFLADITNFAPYFNPRQKFFSPFFRDFDSFFKNSVYSKPEMTNLFPNARTYATYAEHHFPRQTLFSTPNTIFYVKRHFLRQTPKNVGTGVPDCPFTNNAYASFTNTADELQFCKPRERSHGLPPGGGSAKRWRRARYVWYGSTPFL